MFVQTVILVGLVLLGHKYAIIALRVIIKTQKDLIVVKDVVRVSLDILQCLLVNRIVICALQAKIPMWEILNVTGVTLGTMDLVKVLVVPFVLMASCLLLGVVLVSITVTIVQQGNFGHFWVYHMVIGICQKVAG
jgi:hypothetical protein